ncbi:hypothetical protein G4O51_12745, partial [Candidatus Bathyarchaeota archaeon A05DMB-2]|nr:hypothetical protein [Candidatus Bathyarchaeota archaeon A05DMB-2]
TIFVEPGTYYGNVVVNKNDLKLIGENRETTIIDGNKTGVCVLATASNLTICGFTIKNAEVGMRIESDGNKIENNVITNNGCGISIFFSNDNALRDNNVTGNFLNFGVEGYSLTDFIHNIDTTNTVNGKPIHYLINQSNLIIDRCAFSEIGYLAVINSTNVTVSRLHLSKNVQGVLFAYTSNSMIRDMNVSENSVGIYLVNSENNSIYNNVITANYRGFYIEHSNNSTIYHNNIIQNLLAQVLSFYSTNAWDNSYPSGGNFWSNYAGVDEKSGSNQDKPGSDGVGDAPYVIDAYDSIEPVNEDRYPLMGPLTVFNTGTWNGTAYNVDVVSNSAVSDFYFNPDEGAFLRFNVTGETGTAGFCRVTIPIDLLWVSDGQWSVFVGDQPVNYTIIPNKSYTYLYFTYNHSTQTVIIHGTHVVPEFPPSLILPLFLTSTLLAVIFSRRKQKPKLKTLQIQIHCHFSERT